jgi:hypothetical protein
MTWWERWLSRLRPRPVEPVELDPVQQLTVRALGRFGPLPFSRVAAEVTATRPATPADVVSGLLRLEAAGIIERLPPGRPAPPTSLPLAGQELEGRAGRGDDRRYRLTRRGRRIARYIPAEPRSVRQFSI